MFISNQVFEVNGVDMENLEFALNAAMRMSGPHSIKSYHISNTGGILFGWLGETSHGWTALPVAADVKYMAQAVRAYLSSQQAEDLLSKEPACAGDGTVEKGWLVYHPQQPIHGVSFEYAVVGVKPSWAYFAK